MIASVLARYNYRARELYGDSPDRIPAVDRKGSVHNLLFASRTVGYQQSPRTLGL
jgi:hypothetical protein